MAGPDGQESEHLQTYLEISRHQGVTWWVAHTVTSVQAPKHVHHPWSQVSLCSNTRIGSVSEAYLMYLVIAAGIHVFTSIYECILMYLHVFEDTHKIHQNTPQMLRAQRHKKIHK